MWTATPWEGRTGGLPDRKESEPENSQKSTRLLGFAVHCIHPGTWPGLGAATPAPLGMVLRGGAHRLGQRPPPPQLGGCGYGIGRKERAELRAASHTPHLGGRFGASVLGGRRRGLRRPQ